MSEHETVCSHCAAPLGGESVEYVRYSDYRAQVDKLLGMVASLSRAVLAAEVDLTFNRPTEAHSKLSLAWREWFGNMNPEPEKFAAEPAHDKGEPQP